jgi:hypothetical protein
MKKSRAYIKRLIPIIEMTDFNLLDKYYLKYYCRTVRHKDFDNPIYMPIECCIWTIKLLEFINDKNIFTHWRFNSLCDNIVFGSHNMPNEIKLLFTKKYLDACMIIYDDYYSCSKYTSYLYKALKIVGELTNGETATTTKIKDILRKYMLNKHGLVNELKDGCHFELCCCKCDNSFGMEREFVNEIPCNETNIEIYETLASCDKVCNLISTELINYYKNKGMQLKFFNLLTKHHKGYETKYIGTDEQIMKEFIKYIIETKYECNLNINSKVIIELVGNIKN